MKKSFGRKYSSFVFFFEKYRYTPYLLFRGINNWILKGLCIMICTVCCIALFSWGTFAGKKYISNYLDFWLFCLCCLGELLAQDSPHDLVRGGSREWWNHDYRRNLRTEGSEESSGDVCVVCHIKLWCSQRQIHMNNGHTLKRGFSFFRAVLNASFSWFKSSTCVLWSLKTTAIVSCSGPPPIGGTPIAAVSRMASFALLQILSISMELTWKWP